ncbi:hypothetical protein SALBM311S_10478 [Streptomyces alboniger]
MLRSRALENSLENFLKSEKVRDRILGILLAAPGELGKVVAEVVGDGKAWTASFWRLPWGTSGRRAGDPLMGEVRPRGARQLTR